MSLAQGDCCCRGKGRTIIRKVDRRHHQHGVTPMLSLIPGDRRHLQKWMESADDNGVTVALTSSGGRGGRGQALSPVTGDPSTVTGTIIGNWGETPTQSLETGAGAHAAQSPFVRRTNLAEDLKKNKQKNPTQNLSPRSHPTASGEAGTADLDPHETGRGVTGQRVPGEGVEALALKARPGLQADGRHATPPFAPCKQCRRVILGNRVSFYSSWWPPGLLRATRCRLKTMLHALGGCVPL